MTMGRLDTPFAAQGSAVLKMPGNVVIVAPAADIAGLRAQIGERGAEGLSLVELGSGEALPPALARKASLLVVELDPGSAGSMQRLADLRRTVPGLPVIVALRDANVHTVRALLREGVNDVAALPFNYPELATQLLELAATADAERLVSSPLAPKVLVARSTGGCGATTVTTHLAAALGAHEAFTRPGCLFDLDIQFGNVGAALGRSGRSTIIDLLEAGRRLDADLLHSVAIASDRHFDFIAAPEAITPLEAVDADKLLAVINLARRAYGWVLLDLPADWTNWTLSAALGSTDIILITDLSITGLRQARRRLDLFDSIGIPRERVRIVVNRVEKRLFRTIGVEEVQAALGHPVCATLAAEPAVLQSAQDQGLLAGEVNRRSKFAADIAALAETLRRNWGY